MNNTIRINNTTLLEKSKDDINKKLVFLCKNFSFLLEYR